MNYEQDRDAAGGADRIPAFLFVNYAIPVRDDVRILEDSRRRFKCDTVFSAVDAILPLIPRENHVYLQNCSTIVPLDLALQEPVSRFLQGEWIALCTCCAAHDERLRACAEHRLRRAHSDR